jgi:uncharacterized membrane protein
MAKQSIVLIVVLLAALNSTLQAANVRYNITDLGTLDGFDVAQAWGINNQGEVVGVVQEVYSGSVCAVLFDSTGAGDVIDLGTLGGETASALSINNSGQIVGSAEVGWEPYYSCTTIFDPNGSGNNIMAGPCNSYAWANNDNGQLVGAIKITPGDYRRAALFEPDSEPNVVNLGPLPQYSHSEALSINNSGLIVGYAYNPNSVSYYADCRAVLFDSTGQDDNIDLGTLPGYNFSVAFSVNNSGQIVGRVNNIDMSVENWNPRAILFDSTGDGNNIDLGSLPDCNYSEAFCINNKGQIVGRAISETWKEYAVLFDSTGSGNNINLNDLINPTSGWTLHLAWAINDNGWIIGWGCNSNCPPGQYSFLLTPATPGDFEPDRDVDSEDFAVLAAAWRSTPSDNNWNRFCDISEPSDNVIDEKDLKVFTENWLSDI